MCNFLKNTIYWVLLNNKNIFMKILKTFVLFFVSSICVAQQNNFPAISSVLTNATVYYGYGAELNHSVKTNIKKGQQEIIVGNISATADENTIQIAAPENVVLLSYKMEINNNNIKPVNPLIKKMEDSIKTFQKQISSQTQDYQLQEEQLTKTSKILDVYTANSGKNINTTEILKLIDYYNAKIQYYNNNMYAIKQKSNDLQERITEIQIRITELRKKDYLVTIKPTAFLKLQVIAKEAQEANFAISYYTPTAGWVPTYDMRVKTLDNSFKLVYKASISQTTGIDWHQTKLMLSTNNPNLGTNIPVLNAWNLQLYVPQIYDNMRKAKNANKAYNRVQGMGSEVVVSEDNMTYKKSYAEASPATVETSDISNYTNLNESQLFTSFEIDLPYDIPSDGLNYSVAIKEEKIKATYKHYAIPKLDKDAFLLAEINDWESLDLLPGEANIIMDNVYLGKSFVDPISTLDTLNFSLGRDRRVSTKRMLVKEFSKTRFIGSNKIETFTYEITVKNNKKEVVNMILKDQYPISRIKEVEIKLDELSEAEINEELGILNWKISLQPGEQKKYRFSYTVKYPKDKKIINLR